MGTRNTLILLLFLVMASLPVMGQEPTYSVSYENASIESVLKDLTRLTGYEFVYQKGVVDQACAISYIVRAATLTQILNRTLVAQCGLEYDIVKQTIVLRKSSRKTRFVKRSVSGMVVDDEGNLLPGVSVRLQGR